MEDYIKVIPIILKGFNITLYVLLGSIVVSFIIAFLAGFGRLAKHPLLRMPTSICVEIFRGTSLVVQLFWFYFVLPEMLGLQDVLTNTQTALIAGILAISLNYGSYMSEVVRSSILAVPTGQYEASTALNMSRLQRMRLVIFPQAFRMMLPDFGNYLIQMLKATSLVYLVTLADMTYQAKTFQGTHLSMTIPIYVMLLLVYFVISLPLLGLTKWFERLASKGVANQ